MQSLTVMRELKLNRPFCLPYQRHPHQLHLFAGNCEEECQSADASWMSLSIKQNILSVAFLERAWRSLFSSATSFF